MPHDDEHTEPGSTGSMAGGEGADDLPEVYELETLEQLRAISDELRRRIVEALAHRAMTVTQLGELLGQAPAKIHYHVRELERVGLIRLVATREKSGILEKYYRTVAKGYTASRSLLLNTSPDDALAAMREFLDNASRLFLQATEYTVRNQLWENPKIWGVSTSQVWITFDEMKGLAQRIQEEFEKYAESRGIEGEEERTIVMMGYDPRIGEQNRPASPSDQPAAPDAQAPEAPQTLSGRGARRLRSRHVVVAGSYTLSHFSLEEAIAQQRPLDISAIGAFTVADDVTPELIEQAVRHFRHRGVLNASPAVREALKRKE